MSTLSPEEPYVRMQDHLRPNERLLWAGRPDPGFRIGRGDVFGFVFAAVWTAFAVVWESTVIAQGAPLIMRLWGLPFIALGLNLLIGRPFREYRRKQRTLYAVTDQRAITSEGTAKLTDIPLAATVMDVSRSSDNRRASVFLRLGPDSQRPDLMFKDMPDPDRLLSALNQARTPR